MNELCYIILLLSYFNFFKYLIESNRIIAINDDERYNKTDLIQLINYLMIALIDSIE